MITYASFEPNLILSQVEENKIINLNINGTDFKIKACSLRLMCFKLNKTCVCCGIEGSVILVQKSTERDKRPHFNFYALGEYGKLILMTKDHVIPSSKGGSGQLSNLQTMCTDCNNIKENHLNISFEDIIKTKLQKRNIEHRPKTYSIKKMRDISKFFLEKCIKDSYNNSEDMLNHIQKFIENIDVKKRLNYDELFQWSKLIESQIIKGRI